MSEQDNYTHKIPGRADRRWYEPTLGQALWYAAFGGLFYVLYTRQYLIAAGIVLLIGVFGGIPYREGPGYVVVKRWINSRVMRRRNGVIYSTNLADTLYEPDHPSRTEKILPDVKLVSIPIVDQANAVHQLGLVHTAKNGYDTTYLSADGWSRAVMSDSAQRMMLDMTFASALKRAANRISAPLTMVMFFVRRPADDSEAINYLGRRLHTDVALSLLKEDDGTPQSATDRRIMQNIQQASDEVYTNGAKVTMGIALRCPRPKSWAKYDLSELPEQVVARSPLLLALNLLAADLHGMGISGVRRLSLFNMNALLRGVFDCVDLKSFYRDLAVDKERERSGELTSLRQSMTLARGPWPLQLYAHNDRLEADRTSHRVFWIRNFDITEVPPGFFQELFNIRDVWYQVAYYIETVPGSREYRRAANKRRYLRKTREFLHPPGWSSESDPRYEAETQEAAQQHYDIFHSASRGTRTRLMIIVSSSSEEQLELDVEEVDAVCRAKGMVMQAYLGEATQLDAMLASIGIVPA